MRKPSIFSKDYERQMKARRKKIIIMVLILILALLLIFTKILASELNFDNLRVKVQTWIDSDEKITEEIEVPITIDEGIKNEEVKETPLLIKEFKISNGNVLKVKYDKLNEKELFTEVIENKDNIYTTFNKEKDLLLSIDKNQEMKIFYIDGEEKVITKTIYVSPNGESFNKDDILGYYTEYVWHGNAKFVSNNKIAYISNMPYFGYNLNEYIWIYNIESNEHKLLLTSISKEIELKDLTNKGLEVTLDGNVKYVNDNGEIVN